MVNWHIQDTNIGFAVEVVTGTATFSVQHTYDDANNVQNLQVYGLAAGQTFSPLEFNHAVVASQNATIDGSYITPVSMIRLLTLSGTGQLRFRMLQSGIG